MSRPTPTAGDGKSTGNETGDDRRFSCVTCGFPCKPGRDSEDGEAVRTATVKSATEPAYLETVTSGCPACGSKAWRKKQKIRG